MFVFSLKVALPQAFLNLSHFVTANEIKSSASRRSVCLFSLQVTSGWGGDASLASVQDGQTPPPAPPAPPQGDKLKPWFHRNCFRIDNTSPESPQHCTLLLWHQQQPLICHINKYSDYCSWIIADQVRVWRSADWSFMKRCCGLSSSLSHSFSHINDEDFMTSSATFSLNDGSFSVRERMEAQDRTQTGPGCFCD